LSARVLRDMVRIVMKGFPCVESPVDLLILLEVGHYQESGTPLAIKGLLFADIGAPATVTRHLQRLVDMRFVSKQRAGSDGRCVRLVLTAKTWRRIHIACQRMEQLLVLERQRRDRGQSPARAGP
jgi:hypothetical protein